MVHLEQEILRSLEEGGAPFMVSATAGKNKFSSLLIKTFHVEIFFILLLNSVQQFCF